MTPSCSRGSTPRATALIAEKLEQRALSPAGACACLLAAHHSQGTLARPAGSAQRNDQAAFLAGIKPDAAGTITRITSDRLAGGSRLIQSADGSETAIARAG